MNLPRKTVLVTDLDNTLWDWVTIWHKPFAAMLAELTKLSGLSESTLESEIRAIHQQYGTSEYAFLIEALPSLQSLHPGTNLMMQYEGAIRVFREARDEVLHPYPGVRETLRTIKERGTHIVGYTESLAFYTEYRLRKMGLDALFDVLYSPPDHDLPAPLSEIRRYPNHHYAVSTDHQFTPLDALKPNPKILLSILKDIGAAPSDAVYVGDSIMKDIAMAQEAGVLDVHAQYGAAQRTEAYALLRRVSHWSDADVEREREIMKKPPCTPTIVLHCGYSELLDKVDFGVFRRQVTTRSRDGE